MHVFLHQALVVDSLHACFLGGPPRQLDAGDGGLRKRRAVASASLVRRRRACSEHQGNDSFLEKQDTTVLFKKRDVTSVLGVLAAKTAPRDGRRADASGTWAQGVLRRTYSDCLHACIPRQVPRNAAATARWIGASGAHKPRSPTTQDNNPFKAR